MSKEVNTLTEAQLVGMARKIVEESWKDMVKKGVVGASMLGMLAGSGAMQSCRGTSHFDPQWSTEVLTWDQRIEKTWQLHDERGDWEGIEDGVGFCFWCGTRCANSGGGWTVCVVFKDKSTGEFIWPQENKRPNDQGLDNEYTSDRIDTNGLTPCGSNSTCGTTPNTNEEKQRINMQIKESQLAEALVEIAKRVMKEAEEQGVQLDELSPATMRSAFNKMSGYGQHQRAEKLARNSLTKLYVTQNGDLVIWQDMNRLMVCDKNGSVKFVFYFDSNLWGDQGKPRFSDKRAAVIVAQSIKDNAVIKGEGAKDWSDKNLYIA